MEYFKNLGYTEDPNYEMCWKKMVNVLEKEKQSFDYIYDWTTNINLKERKKKDSSVGKKKFKRKAKKHYTTNHQKISEIEGKIKLKVKDVDDKDEEEESGSGYSNKASIDQFDEPGNHSVHEETQCCEM